MTNPKRNPIPPELSTRAQTALCQMGVGDLSELAHTDPKTLIRDLLEQRGVGKSVAWEIAGALLYREWCRGNRWPLHSKVVTPPIKEKTWKQKTRAALKAALAIVEASK